MTSRRIAALAGLLTLLSAVGWLQAAPLDGARIGKVLLVGDSMMRSLERSLTRSLEQHGIEAHASSSIGTGLARLDVYDWPSELAKLVAEQGARTVFIMMGANDNQAMQTGGGIVSYGEEPWRTEYGRRVGQTMDALLAAGAERVIWIGLPPMREAALDADVKVINAIIQRQAAARSQVQLFETYDLFSREGAFSPYILQADGRPLNVRARDGIHFSRPGSDHLAGILIDALNKLIAEPYSPGT